jgi:hypothetical protein
MIAAISLALKGIVGKPGVGDPLRAGADGGGRRSSGFFGFTSTKHGAVGSVLRWIAQAYSGNQWIRRRTTMSKMVVDDLIGKFQPALANFKEEDKYSVIESR